MKQINVEHNFYIDQMKIKRSYNKIAHLKLIPLLCIWSLIKESTILFLNYMGRLLFCGAFVLICCYCGLTVRFFVHCTAFVVCKTNVMNLYHDEVATAAAAAVLSI